MLNKYTPINKIETVIEKPKTLQTPVLLRQAHKINWSNSHPQRAGIILYDSTGIYLGVDNNSKELTDFGGEINYINEDTIKGSLREYREETLGSFPVLSWFQVFSSFAVLSDSIVIFLVKVNEDLQPLIKQFQKRKNKRRFTELYDIIHIKKEEIKNYPVYDKIKPLIYYAIDNYSWS